MALRFDPTLDGAITYRIAVASWDLLFDFGANMFLEYPERFSEHIEIILAGTLVTPAVAKVDKVRLRLTAHRFDVGQARRTDIPQRPTVGDWGIHDGVLVGLAFVPIDVTATLVATLAANRVREVHVRGNKLRYRKADIFSVRLDTRQEDEEPIEL